MIILNVILVELDFRICTSRINKISINIILREEVKYWTITTRLRLLANSIMWINIIRAVVKLYNLIMKMM